MRYDYHILEVIAIGLLLGGLLGFATTLALSLVDRFSYEITSYIFLWFIVIYSGGMAIVGTYAIVMCLLQEQFRDTQAETWGQIPLK